jgi:hypothetical protein
MLNGSVVLAKATTTSSYADVALFTDAPSHPAPSRDSSTVLVYTIPPAGAASALPPGIRRPRREDERSAFDAGAPSSASTTGSPPRTGGKRLGKRSPPNLVSVRAKKSTSNVPRHCYSSRGRCAAPHVPSRNVRRRHATSECSTRRGCSAPSPSSRRPTRGQPGAVRPLLLAGHPSGVRRASRAFPRPCRRPRRTTPR